MTNEKIPLWRDERVIKVALQVLVLLIIVIIFSILGSNLINNYQEKGFTFGFDFLEDPANFDIGEKLISYKYSDSNTQALLVGLINTFRVIIISIILATILGTTIGIGRLSDNWLVKQIAAVYIGIIRNTPLLLQLLFWYSAVFLQLPSQEKSLNIGNLVFLSNRGMSIPWLQFNQKNLASTRVTYFKYCFCYFNLAKTY